MKIIKAFIPLVMAMGLLLSCENEDWEFPDFDYTTTYFPYQYPVRTLVLGDYVFDNENDNQLKFLISPRVGGMYENKKDWIVDFRVNETLAQNLELSDGTPVQVLPQSYYTLNPVDKITIPSGEFHSGIEVQLTEEFLSDPLAASFNYVIPLEIVSSTTDSVLVGQTTLENADPRNPAHWNVVPKHFTLFGIKYVNP